MKEKILYTLLAIGLLFLQLSAFGVFNNYYAAACEAAGWGWKVAGAFLTAVSVFIFINQSQTHNPSRGIIILGGIIHVLALCAYAGFSTPYNAIP